MALEVITYTHNLMNQNIYDIFEFMNNQFRSLKNQGNKYEPKKKIKYIMLEFEKEHILEQFGQKVID